MSCPWIKLVSKESLAIPLFEFLKFCHCLEQHFKVFHCNHKYAIDKNPNVFERLHNPIIELYPDWPNEIIISFLKTRTRIKVNNLNKKIKLKNAVANLRKCRRIGQFTN
uniref:Uncharacterized protein n=1 Tax=Lepeophtheirus salmonis TaxID=72036 RepID=A0A0K2U1Y4_LEPSM